MYGNDVMCSVLEPSCLDDTAEVLDELPHESVGRVRVQGTVLVMLGEAGAVFPPEELME